MMDIKQQTHIVYTTFMRFVFKIKRFQNIKNEMFKYCV